MAMKNITVETIHDAIESKEPENYSDLVVVVNKYLPANWGWSASKVFYNGFYQGIRVFLSSPKKEYQLPSPTNVYSMPNPTQDLRKVFVDEEGKEVGSFNKGGIVSDIINWLEEPL